jgi:hypothetical protein
MAAEVLLEHVMDLTGVCERAPSTRGATHCEIAIQAVSAVSGE